MKLISALGLFLAVALTSLSAQAQTYPAPNRIYANVEYELGYMGCIVKIQHGQYGYFGFANIDRVTGRETCFLTVSIAYASLGSGLGRDGVSAIAAGDERRARFIIHAQKYGLKCRLELNANANGTWSAWTMFVEGVKGSGVCPATPAWILRNY